MYSRPCSGCSGAVQSSNYRTSRCCGRIDAEAKDVSLGLAHPALDAVALLDGLKDVMVSGRGDADDCE